MRKLFLILIAFFAVVTFIRALTGGEPASVPTAVEFDTTVDG